MPSQPEKHILLQHTVDVKNMFSHRQLKATWPNLFASSSSFFIFLSGWCCKAAMASFMTPVCNGWLDNSLKIVHMTSMHSLSPSLPVQGPETAVSVFCCCLHTCCNSVVGEPTVSWLVVIKLCYSNLWEVTLHSHFQPYLHPSPVLKNSLSGHCVSVCNF